MTRLLCKWKWDFWSLSDRQQLSIFHWLQNIVISCWPMLTTEVFYNLLSRLYTTVCSNITNSLQLKTTLNLQISTLHLPLHLFTSASNNYRMLFTLFANLVKKYSYFYVNVTGFCVLWTLELGHFSNTLELYVCVLELQNTWLFKACHNKCCL